MHGAISIMAKKHKPAPGQRTAADRRTIVKARTASPHDQVLGSGDSVETYGIEKVERVIDTIEVMFKRRQLTDRQKRAADTYSHAYDMQFSTLNGTLNPDKVGGAKLPGSPPGPTALMAAQTINEAERKLGALDGSIVELIVGRGYSIEQCAMRVYGVDDKGHLHRDDKLATGKRLRDSLDTLADLWHVESAKSGKTRSWIGDRPTAEASEGEITPSRVAHVGRGKVEWSGK